MWDAWVTEWRDTPGILGANKFTDVGVFPGHWEQWYFCVMTTSKRRVRLAPGHEMKASVPRCQLPPSRILPTGQNSQLPGMKEEPRILKSTGTLDRTY